MVSRTLKIVISLLASLLLVWLAFRGVDFRELWQEMKQVSLFWVLPFVFALLFSHYCRAERWRMLLKGEERIPSRPTLFAGVMTGYMLNYIFPRLGEVTRPVYVARQSKIGTGGLFGTIVLERLIDLICLVGFLIYIVVALLSDSNAIVRIFGADILSGSYWVVPLLLLILLVLFLWTVHRWVHHPETLERISNPLLKRLVGWIIRFLEGFKAIRRIDNWPGFIFLTIGVWGGYVLMTWLPFWMLDLHTTYELGFMEAVIITVISAAGMTVPTPGGIGSYHLFVQQSLWILYSVPLVTGLTYATVTHAANLIVVIVVGLGTLWYDKYYTTVTTG